MNKDKIKEVILDSRTEIFNFKVLNRYFKFEEFGNYVFVGIRRAGKSYLLYQRMQELLKSGVSKEEIVYVNFEDERLAGMTSNDLNLVLEAHFEMSDKKPILFLDEIQNIDSWEKFVRRLADNKYRIYITGSNAKMLSKDIQTTLGGRFIPVDVYPYNFKEFLAANNIDYSEKSLLSTKTRSEILRKFSEYFSFGGFPEITMFSAKRDYLTSVYQKIFLGDIAVRYSVENTFALRLLFKKLAESIKQPISFSRIANIVASAGAKVSTNTIINYVDYAKDAWLLTPIQNIAGKIVEKETNPKYYFTDNGILNLFLTDPNTFLLENIVAINLLREYGRTDSVYFYNKDIEVDFYIPDTSVAIQVCFAVGENQETLERECKALVKLSETLKCEKLLIITRDEEKNITYKEKQIELIPVWKWLLS